MYGVIGGTGFGAFERVEVLDRVWVDTPFGETSGPVISLAYEGVKFAFMARHGTPHSIPPHLVNYRANLFALKSVGVCELIAVNAVGSMHPEFAPGSLALPDQIIDYTYGREHSIYDGVYAEAVEHIDFTLPYTNSLREKIVNVCHSMKINVLDKGVYGATQGPRLESAAEINRLKRDGCDMVGMTGMPEAALARELNLDYACIAMSANWAAGLSDEPITMDDIRAAVQTASQEVSSVLLKLLCKH